jgi:hypothetical protein
MIHARAVGIQSKNLQAVPEVQDGGYRRADLPTEIGPSGPPKGVRGLLLDIFESLCDLIDGEDEEPAIGIRGDGNAGATRAAKGDPGGPITSLFTPAQAQLAIRIHFENIKVSVGIPADDRLTETHSAAGGTGKGRNEEEPRQDDLAVISASPNSAIPGKAHQCGL